MSPEISIPILIDCFSDLPDPRIDYCKLIRESSNAVCLSGSIRGGGVW
jgi:hypothetical protein